MPQQKSIPEILKVVVVVGFLSVGDPENSVNWMLEPTVVEWIVCIALDDGARVVNEKYFWILRKNCGLKED